jgi:hypothetical protein
VRIQEKTRKILSLDHDRIERRIKRLKGYFFRIYCFDNTYAFRIVFHFSVTKRTLKSISPQIWNFTVFLRKGLKRFTYNYDLQPRLHFDGIYILTAELEIYWKRPRVFCCRLFWFLSFSPVSCVSLSLSVFLLSVWQVGRRPPMLFSRVHGLGP